MCVWWHDSTDIPKICSLNLLAYVANDPFILNTYPTGFIRWTKLNRCNFVWVSEECIIPLFFHSLMEIKSRLLIQFLAMERIRMEIKAMKRAKRPRETNWTRRTQFIRTTMVCILVRVKSSGTKYEASSRWYK